MAEQNREFIPSATVATYIAYTGKPVTAHEWAFCVRCQCNWITQKQVKCTKFFYLVQLINKPLIGWQEWKTVLSECVIIKSIIGIKRERVCTNVRARALMDIVTNLLLTATRALRFLYVCLLAALNSNYLKPHLRCSTTNQQIPIAKTNAQLSTQYTHTHLLIK